MRRLHEWVAMNKTNTTSNNSSTQSNSYKNRFKKLVSYTQTHAVPMLDKSEVELLDTHALHYKQYFKGSGGVNWTSALIINISRFDTKWTIKYFIDDDFKDSRTGNDYDNLIRALSFYLNLPNPGTSDYDDLLVESINNITEEFKDYENLWD